MKRWLPILALIFFLFCLFLYQNQIYWFTPKYTISPNMEQELVRLTQIALNNNEVPVACIIIYQDSIIGRGYNTVTQHQNIGGHAELNAISSAVYQMGYTKFMQLERSKLQLLSTYEPCLMCKGAMINYNIQHSIFVTHKSWWHWTKQNIKSLRYEWNKQKVKTIQDNLKNLLYLIES